jgi:hypothetical protein
MMYVMIVTYEVEGDVDAFLDWAERQAPAVAATEGLTAKLWLDGDGREYGGVYLFTDEASAVAYQESAVFDPVRHLPGVDVRCYDLWAEPTAITGGGLTVGA